MPVDASVVVAVRAAVEASPDNVALRIHLVELLVDSALFAEALEHCSTILHHQPDHLDALKYAAQSAEATGATAKAESYRRLYVALSAGALQTTEAPPQAVTSASTQKPQASDRDETSKAAIPEANVEVSLTSEIESHGTEAVITPDEESGERAKVVPLRLVAGGASDDSFEAEQPEITMADVAGMDEVKRRLNLAFLAPMKNPEMRKIFGKSMRGGLLLYGPPGCGKTFIARAAAGELGARFMSVGLSDVLDMWLGQSERNLHETFETARRNAPCVLFFDEIDALGRKRSLVRHSAEHNVINQLLAEMDSVGKKNEGLFVLAATNHPWDVDTALRRPGRLDRVLLVLPPDKTAREAIMQFHLRNRPIDKLDTALLATKTEDFSGADIAYLCEAAAELAMEEALLAGKARPITLDDFKKAMRDIRPSTRAWFDMARNYAMFANEGGMYDDLLNYLRTRKWI